MLNLLADEIDAIGTKRYESQSGGEREIQRTMLELLNQMDGFDSMGDVKVPINLLMCMAIPQATWPDPIHLHPPPSLLLCSAILRGRSCTTSYAALSRSFALDPWLQHPSSSLCGSERQVISYQMKSKHDALAVASRRVASTAAVLGAPMPDAFLLLAIRDS